MRRFLILAAICAASPIAAAFAASTVSGTFTGTTSQGKPVTIKIVSDRLEHSSLAWTASCTQPRTTLKGTTVLNGNMDAHSYKRRQVYTVSVERGVKAKHTANTQFTVSGHRLHGTFRLTAVVYSSPRTTCTTPKITFSARS
jgi:hypothetical protein